MLKNTVLFSTAAASHIAHAVWSGTRDFLGRFPFTAPGSLTTIRDRTVFTIFNGLSQHSLTQNISSLLSGGVTSTGEALHEALERHIFIQHGYEYPALDPANLAEHYVDAGGEVGGICPSVTHFVGERINVCRMTR